MVNRDNFKVKILLEVSCDKCHVSEEIECFSSFYSRSLEDREDYYIGNSYEMLCEDHEDHLPEGWMYVTKGRTLLLCGKCKDETSEEKRF